MEPRALAAVYDRIAHHWAAPAFNPANGIAAHEWALALRRTEGGRALDVGCGANGRFIELLQRHARARHPLATFHHADVCVWEPTERYDFITAWDSIWHVPLDRQLGVIAKLCAALAPGGVLIFTSGGIDEPGEVTNPCHGEPLYHAAPGVPNILRTLRESSVALRRFEFDLWPELHVFFVAQRA
jgi:SAM-dependent methyltransferase